MLSFFSFIERLHIFSGINGKLKWDGNWVSYLDTMLQFSILSISTKSLYLPTRLQYVRINPEIHEKKIMEENDVKEDDEETTKHSGKVLIKLKGQELPTPICLEVFEAFF